MAEPELIGRPPPPVTRDARVICWIAASVISWIGSTAWGVALAWVAVRHLPADRAGLVIAISSLPQALVTLAGGIIADRCDTRRVMVASQLAHIGVLSAGACLWERLPTFWLLAGLGLCFGLATGLASPAAATLGRQLVATQDLATVAGWNQVASRLARMAGAPIGAAMVVTAGLPAVMLLDAATFAVTAAVLLWVVRPRYRLHGTVQEPWGASLRAGISYLRQDRTALVFVAGLCGLNVFSSPVTSLAVPLRITASRWPSTTLGAAEAMFSAAAITGSLIALRWRRHRPALTAYLLLATQGVAYAGISLDHRAALLACMGIIGATAGCASVWLSALFVQIVQPAYLGRVASLSTLGDLLLAPLAAPAFGALTNTIGINQSPLIPAVLMLMMCLAILVRRDIRTIVTPA